MKAAIRVTMTVTIQAHVRVAKGDFQGSDNKVHERHS